MRDDIEPLAADDQRHVDRLISAARGRVADEQADLPVRLAAGVEHFGIGDGPAVAGDRRMMADLLSPRQGVELQLAAVAQLDAVAGDGAPQILLQRWSACSPAVRGDSRRVARSPRASMTAIVSARSE